MIARTATLVVGYIVVALAAGIAVAFARFIFWLIRSIVQREQRPWAAFKEILHENRFRALCAVLGILIAAIGMSAFSAMKSRLPAAVPFYADLSLANFDYWLFGQDAWRSFDAWFGSVAYPISAIYGYWLPIHCIAFTAVVLSRPSPLKSQAIIAFGLMWLFLGLCFAYAFSSAGPIFYDRIYGGHRFADLNTSVQPYFGVHRAAEYLWGRYMSGDISFGGGISAMVKEKGSTWGIRACAMIHWPAARCQLTSPSRKIFGAAPSATGSRTTNVQKMSWSKGSERPPLSDCRRVTGRACGVSRPGEI